MVRAVKGGVVLNAGGTYGTVAVFDGQNTTISLHLSNISVRVGQQIAPGTVIGRVGAVGTSRAHYHVEERRGRSQFAVGPTSGGNTANLTVNPALYLGR